ncbi:hypothetical protein A2160_04005, partial [Candidatus Beckwithbacteria bacterium RBG_13_42_9]
MNLSAQPEKTIKPYFLGLIFLLTLVPLFYGFTRFPRLYGDEGIYVSQAWWLVYFHKLGPYTYWYDHFPLGWLLIGLWQKLTGGPFTFGPAIFSGRVLMIILAGFANVFLFKLIHKLTKSLHLAFLGALLFMLFPLSVLYHRLVLLDNIAVLWLLMGLNTFFTNPKSGRKVFLASIFLGLAVLTKEVMFLVLPAFFLSIWWLNAKNNRGYLLVLSLATTLFIIGLWPLLAFLKHEFLPGMGHVSFWETFFSQVKRGNQLPFWAAKSEFMSRFQAWLSLDPFFLFLGFGSLVLNSLFKFFDKTYRVLVLMTWGLIFFLIRGGVVYDFYLIPLLPFLVIQICLLLHLVGEEVDLKFIKTIRMVFFLPVIVGLLAEGLILYRVDATANQLEAISQLKQVNNKEAVIVSDDYAFLDLRFDEELNDRFSNIEWYARAEKDPAVRQQKLRDDPGAIDYLLVNKVMESDILYGGFSFLGEAKANLQATGQFNLKIPDEFLKQKNTIAHFADDLTLYQKTGQPVSAAEKANLSLEQKIGRLVVMTPQATELTGQE